MGALITDMVVVMPIVGVGAMLCRDVGPGQRRRMVPRLENEGVACVSPAFLLILVHHMRPATLA